MKRVMAVLVALVVIAACGDDEDRARDPNPSPAESRPAAVPSPTFPVATAILEGEGDPVMLTVEVAETTEQRQYGYMFRESIPENAGMVFLFFEKHTGGFWMKNTLVPLSIAFFDEKGTIRAILDMDPCKADPCKIYDPGVSYWGALEVNQGAFDEWGISEGDTISVRR